MWHYRKDACLRPPFSRASGLPVRESSIPNLDSCSEQHRIQPACAKLAANGSKCEEWYQRDEQDQCNAHEPRQTPATNCRDTRLQAFSADEPDDYMLNDMEADEQDGQKKGIIQNRIDQRSAS